MKPDIRSISDTQVRTKPITNLVTGILRQNMMIRSYGSIKECMTMNCSKAESSSTVGSISSAVHIESTKTNDIARNQANKCYTC